MQMNITFECKYIPYGAVLHRRFNLNKRKSFWKHNGRLTLKLGEVYIRSLRSKENANYSLFPPEENFRSEMLA